jgi:hypothetical protein
LIFPQTAIAFLFKTPVPNYTDVDLSSSYKFAGSLIDYTTLDEATPYEFVEQVMPVINKIVEHQLTSPQLQTFIRLVQSYYYNHRPALYLNCPTRHGLTATYL